MFAPRLLVVTVSLGWLALSSVAAAENATLHTFTKQKLHDRFFAEGATFGDINHDKHLDLVAGPFWFAGPDFKQQHAYYEPKPFDPNGYSDNFFAYTHDFNADGWQDILIIGFPGREAVWFENPQGQDQHWARHVALKVVDNESPTFLDITGDGQPEIVGSQGGFFGYAHCNPQAPREPWTFHRLSDKSAGGNFTHGLGVGDVNGDGRADLLEKSGWWEQPASLANDPVWKKHPFAFAGPGGAQMFAYDVDGDGRNDVITSLQAHGFGLVWYQQVETADKQISFKPHVITGAAAADNAYGVKFGEIHALDLVDMNGDGLKDIVTGKRYWSHGLKGDPEPGAAAVIYWFELKRTARGEIDWVPHLIDDNSGVGVQVVAGDFTGDKLPDVVVANKLGIFAHTQVAKAVSQEEFDAQQPRRRVPLANGLSGEAAAQAMTVPPGFKVTLQAAEPEIQQPIAMAFDDRGRLWVAEAYSYPIRRPAAEAKDRILIFEDTNGDDKFDKRTVFYEGLNLVSGLELGFGGVFVGAAPELLFIPDRDGDDKPDGQPEVLLDGFGYQDTHETLNSFIWGPDGWLYGCHGVFTHSQVGRPGAKESERVKINAGVWRYHPTRRVFELFAEGTSNPWGVDFNEHGQAFVTACVIPHLYHMIQGGRYQRQAGQHFNPHTYDDIKTIAKHRHWVGNQWNNADRAKSDNNGGGHAHAGAMLYLGGHWPEKYRNQLFMNNIHGARLNQDQLTASGSGYVGDGAPDFCLANDTWSQILYLTYGPDGNVTMIDWYDRNQCHHGNVPGHDRGNGRIFKINYGQTKPVSVDLKKLLDGELVELQLHANQWYVRHARRILQERAVEKKLTANVKASLLQQFAAQDDPVKQLHCLWALHAIDQLDASFLREQLQAKAAPVRAWAVQLLLDGRYEAARDNALLTTLAKQESSPLVRLYLAAALQRMPVAERWSLAQALVAHGEDAQDHNLPLLLWYGIEPLVLANPAQALALAEASQIPLVARYIARRAAAEEAGYDALLTALASAPEAKQLWMLEEMVAALQVRANTKMPQAWQTTYERLLATKNAAILQQAEFIAVKFGDERVLPELRRTLADRKADLKRRELALAALVAGKDRQLPAVLQTLIDDPMLRTAAINALASFDDERTPAVLIAAYAKLPAADQQAALATLTSRAAYVLKLLDAIEAQQIPRNDLSAFTVRQLARLDDPQVTNRLNAVWGTIRATTADKTAEMAKYKQTLTPDTLRAANLPHGRELYTKTCGTCHTLFNQGKQIGPDLTGSNRANLDYLLENLLDPSAVVGKDYQMTLVVTTGGRTLTGIVKEENDSALTLQTPTDRVTIAKSDIEDRQLSTLSLMPEGQLKTLAADDVRDLVAYLASSTQVPLPGEGPWLDPKTGLVSGALEGEAIKILEKSGGNAAPQNMSGFKLGRWSGNSHLWWTGGKPSDKLVLAVPVKSAGKYELFVGLGKAIDYGIVRIAVDNGAPSEPIDLFNDGVVNTPPLSLGVHELAAGEHRLTVTIVGANAKAIKNYMFGLDYVILVPQDTNPKR